MKKILTSLLILSGIYSVSFAQTKNTAEFGVNIGYNQAYITEGPNLNTASISGFNAGVSVEYYFSDSWGIKGKLTYDQKGLGNGYLEFYDNNGNSTEVYGVNYHLNYLTIPVMADWHFGRMRNWYLNFGPYVGVLLNATESSNSGVDIKSGINTTDFGLALGIGVKFPISNSAKLFIETDGQAGVTNVFKNNDFQTGQGSQNVRSSINFGILFPLK
jgi:opacity protein-like surface antigen